MGASPLVSVNIETFLRFRRLRLGGCQMLVTLYQKSDADFTATTFEVDGKGYRGKLLMWVDHLRFRPIPTLAKFSATLKDADTRMGPGQAKGGGVAKNFSHRQGVFRPSRRQAVASFNPMFSPTSQRLNHPPARSPPASSQGPTPALDDLKLWGKLWGIGVRQVKSAFRKFNTFGTC